MIEIQPRTLDGDVLERVRGAILSGRITPGSRINQNRTALHLGVSRGPVRAALAQLAREGLVENIPHRGSFATPLEPSTVRETYGVREALESYAATQAVAVASEAVLRELTEIVARMRRAADRRDVKRLVEGDLDFHRRLIQLSGNRQLAYLWQVAELQVRRILSFRHRSLRTLREIPDSHLETIAALGRGDAAAAADSVQRHIRDACADLVANWPEHKPSA